MRAVSVLYGSQTGCAESIAQQIYNDALARQLDAALMPLNDFQKANLADKPDHHVVIVCSTTGNGEPPDNAGKFWRSVKRRTQPKDMLAGLNFTVLGLGDTNYDRFCYMGKSIDKRFAELGARRYYDMCAADEALGLEDVVEPWLAGLWEAFDKSCTSSSVEDESTASSSSDGSPESEPVVQPTAEPERKDHADLKRHLSANLISYEAMFSRLTGATQVPDDLPRLQSALFTTRYIDGPANEAPETEQDGTAAPQDDEEEPSVSKPFLGSLVGAKYLTTSQSERKVLSMEINLGESGIRFKPGDSIGIKCPNVTDEVDILLERLDLDGAKRVEVEAAAPGRTTRRAVASLGRYPASSTLRDLFLHHTDIRSSPKKAVLRALATYCSDEEERAELLLLSSKLGADKYQTFVADQQLSFLEILLLFPSCRPPLAHVLSLVPQLMPRYYSIASSPLADPKRVTIAFTIVEYTSGPRGITRRGLCSNWMQQIAQPLLDDTQQQTATRVKIPLFLRSTRDFELPESRQAPMLLIGPGTGVSPFIGFLQHRHFEAMNIAKASSENADSPATSDAGAISLFFGCRRKSEDWIFKNEMHSYLENGVLSALFTAFSREQEDKYYVQHDLKANSKLVYDLIQESEGYVFVCGDGVAMARDVHAALVEIVQERGNMSAAAAEARLRELSSSQRYVRDIW